MHANLSSFLQAKPYICLYLTLGWKITWFLISLLGRLYYFRNREEKKRIERALSEGVGRGCHESELAGIQRKVFSGILAHYYEKLFIAFEKPAKATRFLQHHISTGDMDKLRKGLSKGNGVVVVTAHYGAIEYMPTLLAVNGLPVSMIAKFKSTHLKKKVYQQANAYCISLIDGSNAGNVMKAAFHELRQNRVLITQCDEIEAWRPSKTQKTSFLGKVTGLDRTINIIQKRTGAEIAFGIIHRYALNRYRLVLRTSEEMARSLGTRFSVGELILKCLETYIYAHPEQWYEWKKYAQIGVPERPSNPKRTPVLPRRVLKPALGRVH